MRSWLGGLLLLALLSLTVHAADVNDLAGKLKSPDSDVRRAAAKELAGLGSAASPAVAALTAALGDRDRFVRRNAAEALGAIGTEAKSAVPRLALAVNDSTTEVQLAAVEALGAMGAVGAKGLTNAVKDPAKDQAVRVKAALALAKIGKEARSAVPTLAGLLTTKVKKGKGKGKTNDEDIRAEVATALGAIATAEDKSAIAALKSILEAKQKNKQLQKAAGDAYRQITGEEPPKAKKKKKKKNT
jgi:HEAT repeat protein